METPNTEAGALTERIMRIVFDALPMIKTVDYNRIYSGVLKVLESTQVAAQRGDGG